MCYSENCLIILCYHRYNNKQQIERRERKKKTLLSPNVVTGRRSVFKYEFKVSCVVKEMRDSLTWHDMLIFLIMFGG